VKRLKCVNNFRILGFSSLYSDVHSPLHITFSKKKFIENADYITDQKVVIEKEKKNRWDNEKYEEFRTNIESDNINKLKNKILGVKQMVKSKSDINSHTDDLCQICIKPAKTTFGTKLCKNIKYNYRKQIGNPKPWFNYECQLARKNLRKRRRKFENNRTSANHEQSSK
jgi:hypothetical protein